MLINSLLHLTLVDMDVLPIPVQHKDVPAISDLLNELAMSQQSTPIKGKGSSGGNQDYMAGGDADTELPVDDETQNSDDMSVAMGKL